MSNRDGLPLLLPGDPQNFLPIEARKRIERALIKADKFIWKAEDIIAERHLKFESRTASLLRNKARFKKAKSALSVYRKEFSRLDIPERKYREIMNEEIEAATNSLGLSEVQKQLLKTKFFYPKKKPKQSGQTAIRPVVLNKETAAEQLSRLREDSRLTVEQLAAALDIEPRSVYRHLSGATSPYKRYLTAYEKVFSQVLQRKVDIYKLSGSCQ